MMKFKGIRFYLIDARNLKTITVDFALQPETQVIIIMPRIVDLFQEMY